MILASVDISVKGVLPEVVTCPVCRNNALSIYVDPIIGGSSRWLNCGTCGFHGDTLELLARMRNAGIHEVIGRAVHEGLCAVPLNEVSAHDIDDYVFYYPQRRKIVDDAWKAFQDGLRDNPSPELVRRIQDENMWGGWRSGQQDRIARFIGGGTLTEVNKALLPLASGTRKLPHTGFSTSLVLACQDIPGRICAFDFLGNAARLRRKTGSNVHFTEGGLGMLDVLMPFEREVFAVGDPAMAMHLHRRQFTTFTEPLKLVLFNDDTDRAWTNVQADKIVLWDREITWKIFDHARKIPNNRNSVFITINPELMRDTGPYVLDWPLAAILDNMRRHAIPWAEFFIRWLTNPARDPADVHGAIAKLSFDASERRFIQDVCPKELRDRLAQYMDGKTTIQTVYINRHNIMEDRDGWHVVYPMRGKALICDAPITLEREITNTDTGQIFWEGVIRYKGHTIEFFDEVDKIERNPNKWLRERVAKAGLGMPLLQHAWASEFMHLAKVFSQPKLAAISSRLGPQSDGSIVFPQFKLANGEIENAAAWVRMDSSVPAADVRPPCERPITGREIATPTRAAVIACSAALVANWLGRFRNLPPAPVVLIGGTQSAARIAGDHFSQISQMHIHYFTRYGRKEVEIARRSLSREYPTYFRTETVGTLVNYPPACHDFIYVTASEEEAAALITGRTWIAIDAPHSPREDEELPPFDDTLLYLLDLQKRDYDVPKRAYLIESVIVDYCAWYARYLQKDQKDLYKLLAKMVSKPAHPGDGFIKLVIHAYNARRIELDHVHFMTRLQKHGRLNASEFGILIDEKADKVYISEPAVEAALRKKGLPTPDYAEVAKNLYKRNLMLRLDNPHGWVIEKSYWDDMVKGWSDADWSSDLFTSKDVSQVTSCEDGATLKGLKKDSDKCVEPAADMSECQ